MTARVTIDPESTAQAVVLVVAADAEQTTGAELTAALEDAAARHEPPATVVLDLRELDELTVDGAQALRAFCVARADAGVRCLLLLDGEGVVARMLDAADPGQSLPRITDIESVFAEDDTALVQSFGSLTRTLLNAGTVAGALRLILDATAAVIPHADLLSVTLRSPDGAFSTPVSTDDLACELDQVQFHSGTGPCVDAALPDGPAFAASGDLAVEQRWPRFSRVALRHGFRCVLVTELLPERGPGQLSGGLSIYSCRPHALTTEDRQVALLMAAHASLAIAHVRTVEAAALREAQLRRALDSRDVIGQAKGILMHRQNIGADEAFEVLRRTSQTLNIKLVELAGTLAAHQRELEDG